MKRLHLELVATLKIERGSFSNWDFPAFFLYRCRVLRGQHHGGDCGRQRESQPQQAVEVRRHLHRQAGDGLLSFCYPSVLRVEEIKIRYLTGLT